MKIRDKLVIVIIGLTAAPILCISLLAYQSTKSTFRAKIIEKQELLINEAVNDIAILNKTATTHVLLLKNLPPVAGIIRTYPEGADPLKEYSLNQWLSRYHSILLSMMKVDERIDQIRFIYKDGKEIVRVNQDKRGAKVAGTQELQDTSQHIYFKETMALEANQVYVSELSLSVEKGEIAKPYKPVVRFATPIFDDTGVRHGIIVINYRMDYTLSGILARAQLGYRVITDEKGNFIFHPDPSMQFSADLGTGKNYFHEQPELIVNTANLDFKNHYDSAENEYRIWKKIHYNPNDPSKYWLVFSVIPEKELFAALYRLRDVFISINAAALAIIIPLIFLTARSLSGPIEQLKRYVDEAAQGAQPAPMEPSLLRRHDEVGVLARSYESMVRKVMEARLDLEKKVETRTAELQEAKRIAENNEKRFFQFFESSPDAIVMVNKAGEINLINAMAEKLFGYQREELIGQKIEMLIPQRYAHGHVKHRSDYVNKPAPRQMAINLDISAKRKDGSEFNAEINLNPIWINEEMFISSAVRDISERKLNELRLVKLTSDLKRSNAELEQFAYVASHDLQEPLRMVASYTQLLERRMSGKLDEKSKEYIRFAVDGATRMQRLINDLLSFSRVGTRAGEFTMVDCKSVCQDVIENLQLSIQKSHAQIDIGELPTIKGDRTQLLQLFQNLIGNSLKFRAEANPHVQVASIDRGEMWEFSVKDNGIGIDPKYTERVFVIFERLHGNEQFEGTGIGLAVCKKIVERHGGRIWIESNAGKGTTFYFTIPKKEI